MSTAARTPEELETLFEDALLTEDSAAVTALFADGAVLVSDGDRPARGEEIAVAALDAWNGDRPYIADTGTVVQARDIALVVGDAGVMVARRDAHGIWQYAIVLRSDSNETEME
jgi:ketosteroid isomerase-like protein